MKFLKQGLSIILLCVLLGVPAAAEGIGEEIVAVEMAPTFDKVQVHIELTKAPDGEGQLTFGLYPAGAAKAADTKMVVVQKNDRSFNLEFTVPAYEIGEMFLLRLESGEATLGITEPAWQEVWLQTYVWAEGEKPMYQTAFYLNMEPKWARNVRVQMGALPAPAPYYPINGDVYVSDSVFSALGITITKTANDIFLHSGTGNYSMQFFRDNIFACRGGVGYNLSAPVFCQGGTWYLPLYEVGTYFACSYAQLALDREIVHIVNRSAYAPLPEAQNPVNNVDSESYVNSRDIQSQTDYLIWISKKDYTVNVYLGSSQNWKLVKSFPCTIGAPHTPTIEGEFEYIERLSRWEYPSYYCGPVMRFYRGYALHSTLIRYDGTPYDDRVGMQLSLGCIRLHPEDINWLVEYAPMYTKIVITP